MTIAVLAVQGAFIEHEKSCRRSAQMYLRSDRQKIWNGTLTDWCCPAERARYRESFYGSLDCLYLCRRRSEQDCPLWQPVRD